VRVEEIGEFVVPFLNRLSDYLFVVARRANFDSHVSDVLWKQDLDL
jgi:cob(I)alamin adenosyltransferase